MKELECARTARRVFEDEEDYWGWGRGVVT